ncbi:MAG: hypothetical protein KTR25_04720 [Myxococcales bacterium]|nr:hypothetical protein [Myxococcales bacterium]
MKHPDHKKSLLGRVPPGTPASSSERFTKAGLDSYTHGQINRLLVYGARRRLISGVAYILGLVTPRLSLSGFKTDSGLVFNVSVE